MGDRESGRFQPELPGVFPFGMEVEERIPFPAPPGRRRPPAAVPKITATSRPFVLKSMPGLCASRRSPGRGRGTALYVRLRTERRRRSRCTGRARRGRPRSASEPLLDQDAVPGKRDPTRGSRRRPGRCRYRDPAFAIALRAASAPRWDETRPRIDEPALPDPGSLDDPLVRSIHQTRQFLVPNNARRKAAPCR